MRTRDAISMKEVQSEKRGILGERFFNLAPNAILRIVSQPGMIWHLLSQAPDDFGIISEGNGINREACRPNGEDDKTCICPPVQTEIFVCNFYLRVSGRGMERIFLGNDECSCPSPVSERLQRHKQPFHNEKRKAGINSLVKADQFKDTRTRSIDRKRRHRSASPLA